MERNDQLTGNARALRKQMTKEEAKLVVELDGSQHYTPEEILYDQHRTRYLQSQGLTVMRLNNLDVMRQFQNTCEAIDMEVKRKITDSQV